MLSTPGRRALGGAAVAALAVTLTGCAKPTTATTGLGSIPAGPTLSVTPGSALGGAGTGPATPAPSGSTGTPKPPSHSTGGGHPSSAPPSSVTSTWPVLTNEDCIGYNPATVAIQDDGTLGYLISDGSSSMLLLDNMADATAALALVRNYNQQCFIGRDNGRSGNDRYRYIVQYWKGTGVLGATLPAPPDCSNYDRNTVASANIGAGGWLISAGAEGLLLADSQADADNAVALAHRYSHLCYIGRGNTRTMRAEYIVEYFTP
jgi:hypothetical protein